MQMTREEARQLTIGELAQRHDLLAAGDRCNRVLADMKSVYAQVEQFECKNRRKLDTVFGALAFDESTTVRA